MTQTQVEIKRAATDFTETPVVPEQARVSLARAPARPSSEEPGGLRGTLQKLAAGISKIRMPRPPAKPPRPMKVHSRPTRGFD